MNYEENKIDWKIGDIVIHDADAKKKECLMRVIKIVITDEDTRYETEYVDTEYFKRIYGDNDFGKTYFNSKKSLHDPKRFDITLDNPKIHKEEKK